MVHDTALEISNRLGFQVGCGARIKLPNKL
jgi:hypothetical protein